MGRCCSYLLPKQAGGTPQILVDKTSVTSPMTGRLRVYLTVWPRKATRMARLVPIQKICVGDPDNDTVSRLFSTPKRAKFPAEKMEKIYQCPVCLSLPQCKIYQCKQGHLICSECHHKIKKPRKCPTCRIRMQVTPIRSLAAEQVR